MSVDNVTDWIAQQAFDWTMALHSPTPSLSSFASTLSPAQSSPAPLTPDDFDIGFDLSLECMAYQAILFDNPAAPFGLVDPLCYPSINAIYPTYSPPRQECFSPAIPSIYPSHKATQRQSASGAQRTSKKTRSQTSGPYDRASSHRRQHIAEHQRLSFPDERGKPFTRADRQPFATPAANNPGAQPGDLSAPPLGDPLGSWSNQHGVSPLQSTLEEKTSNHVLSSQRAESSASAAPAPVHQNKSRGNPSTKPARKATNVTNQHEIIIGSPRNGPGCHGNPIPDGLTFMEDNFINFQSPPEPTNGEPYTCKGGKNTVEFIWMDAKGKTRKL
ncbi:hypothetical protein NLJ89_g10885 [Agrocybe chaxingu]|uniref:Uncharacterized protein n=1 Tax=Agrocybe chaxingu TaxID=84603 RepID=A0A9W8MS61_9AGAR|nr:hypothetical protein NLJ89_g10885 [Agrocybe chaxingu]